MLSLLCNHEESLFVVLFHLQCILANKVEKAQQVGEKRSSTSLPILLCATKTEMLSLLCNHEESLSVVVVHLLCTHISRFGRESSTRRLERTHPPFSETWTEGLSLFCFLSFLLSSAKYSYAFLLFSILSSSAQLFLCFSAT